MGGSQLGAAGASIASGNTNNIPGRNSSSFFGVIDNLEVCNEGMKFTDIEINNVTKK